MLDALVNLPALLGCLIFMTTIVVVGLVTYVASHKTLFKDKQDALGDATRTIFLGVNLLVGLFLSLTLNDLVASVGEVKDIAEREAVAISDVYNGLRHFHPDQAGDIQQKLIEYTSVLIEDEWPTLAEDRLSDRAEVLLREIGSSVLLLESDDRIENSSWKRISADIDLMSDYRLARLQGALTMPPFFLLVVIFGIIVVMVCLGVYPPSHSLVVLVSIYLSFVGLVVYLILALSNPFQGMLGVDTVPLEHVLKKMQ